jgi:hypothetical protein
MLRPIWSLPVEAAPRGIALAREANRLLVWTESNWLFWTNRHGDRQAQAHFTAPMIGAVSDDGSAFLAAEENGLISWLAPDLKKRWEHRVQGKPVAAAIDPLGLVAAVATSQGQILFFHADGEPACAASTPRPAIHLTFVPGTATVIAAADLGWLAAYDLVKGDWLWRDAPVTTIGGLAVAGAGEPILIACYSEGLRAYQRDGKPLKLSAVSASRSVAISFDGKLIVTEHTDGTIVGHDSALATQFTWRPDSRPTAIALSGLGEVLYVASAAGQVGAFATSAAQAE